MRVRVVGGGRELSGVGALTIFYLSTGLSWSPGWPWGDGPSCGASLVLGTSCGKSSNSISLVGRRG